jgi:hypothetical protein
MPELIHSRLTNGGEKVELSHPAREIRGSHPIRRSCFPKDPGYSHSSPLDKLKVFCNWQTLRIKRVQLSTITYRDGVLHSFSQGPQNTV